MEDKLATYGGQAVIEGVMMRGRKTCAVAMRGPDGNIAIKVELLGKIYQSRLLKTPFLRGLILLWDSFGLGMRALTYSANLQTGENEKLEGPALYLTVALTLLVAVGIFFLVPAGIGWLSEHLLHWNAWWGNLLEGIIRLILLIGYLWGIGYAPDIKRVFAYHGAEHKTINAFEAGADLTPASIAKYSVEHPRCGTAFLLILMILSLFFFTILGPLPFTLRLISRVVMIPVLAGLAYEYLRWTANHLNMWVVRMIVKPNLALQHLTTRQPDEMMLEVALTAFQAMQKADQET